MELLFFGIVNYSYEFFNHLFWLGFVTNDIVSAKASVLTDMLV